MNRRYRLAERRIAWRCRTVRSSSGCFMLTFRHSRHRVVHADECAHLIEGAEDTGSLGQRDQRALGQASIAAAHDFSRLMGQTVADVGSVNPLDQLLASP